MKLSLYVPPSLSVGPKKWLKNAIIGIGGLILVCSPVSAAGLMGPNASAIPTKSVGDSLRITDFNALLDVGRKLFVDEKTAGTADDLVGLGTYTADTGTCPAGTSHVDFNDNTTVEAGECFSGVAVVDGKLGIGTTSPALKMQVVGVNGLPATSGTTPTGIVRFKGVDSSGVIDFGILSSGAGGWIQSTNQDALGSTYPLLLNPNGGNVGIGTTTPGAKLDVVGQAHVDDALQIDGTTPQLYLVDSDGTDWKIVAQDNHLQFLGGASLTEQMRLQSNGLLGIGTTSPAEKLDVVGNIAVSGTVDGVDVSGLSTTVGTKTDKVSGATAGNLAGLDVSGNLTDSGLKLNDLGTAVTDLWSADKVQSAITAGVGTVTEADTLGTVTARGKTTSTGINLNGTLNDLSKGLTFGDADTGFYESADDFLRIVLTGTDRWLMSGNSFISEAGGAGLFNYSSSATVPTLSPARVDTNTGIGSAGADQLSLIAGGVEGIRVNTATTGVNYLDVTPSATTDAVQIATGGTDANIDLALMPKGTGNVGIGTTSPANLLHVNSTTNEIARFESDQTSGRVYFYEGATQRAQIGWGASVLSSIPSSTAMGIRSAGGFAIGTAGNNIAMYINGSQNVGIGDTTPDGTLKLDVEGQVGATGYCDENGANCQTIAQLSDTGTDNQTLDEVLTEGATTTQTITSGNILPEMTGATGAISTRTLGSDTAWFSDLYSDEVHIGANSLYVNGKKVIHDDSDTMTFTTDIDQNVKMYTAGTGGLTLESKDTGNLYLKKSGTNGNLQIESSTNATISATTGISLTVPNTAPSGNHIYLTNNDTDGKIYLNASGISLTSGTAVDVQAGLSATGAITGASFNGVALTDGGSGALTVTGTASISGSNTGDQDLSGFIPYTGGTSNVDLGAHNLTVDTDTLFVNSTDGRVGIGTVTPGAKLDIYQSLDTNVVAISNTNGAFTSDVLKLSQTARGDTDAYNLFQATNTAGTKFIIQGNGNVGIGTAIPSEKLDVVGNIAVSGTVDGVDVAGLSTTVGTKADKVSSATSGNLAGLDATGNLTDSGLALNDSGSTTSDLWSGSKITAAISSGVGEVVEVDTLDSVTGRGATTTNAITTGGLTVDTDTLYVDATNNWVGIGTVTPSTKLELYGTDQTLKITQNPGTAGNSKLWLTSAGADNTAAVSLNGFHIFKNSGTGDLYFGPDTTTSNAKITIQNEGNVGIGTTAPGAKLDVAATGEESAIRINSVNDGYDSVLRLFQAGVTKGVFGFDDSDDVVKLGYSNTLSGAALSINSAGNVGIGTTSPENKLTVFGTGTSSAGIVQIRGTQAQDTFLSFAEDQVATRGGIGFSAGSGSMEFITGGTLSSGTTNMVIDSEGNVGIGTTTPSEKLDIAGGIRIDNNAWISARDDAGTGVVNMFRATTDGSIELGAPLLLGALTADTDSGAVSIFNMPVSGVATAGSEMSASVQLDSENIFKIYSEADGTGGIQNQSVQVSGDVFAVQYCDENGANCKTVSELSDSGTDDQTLTWTDATNILGIVDGNTVEITGFQGADADLDDLADGSLTGSKVGTGISATNVTTGTLPDGVLSSNVSLLGQTIEYGELTAMTSANLATKITNETGTGVVVFNTSPTFTGTVSGITSAMVGLGNVTNESKATMFTNAALTGIPTAPTATSGTNTTQLATTAFVTSAVTAGADTDWVESGGDVYRASGNVGIGTTSPKGLLTLQQAIGFDTAYNSVHGLFLDNSAITAGDGNFGQAIEFGVIGGSPNVKKAAIAMFQDEADSDYTGLAFFTGQSGTASDPVVEAMRIDSTGNVGIGTTSPLSILNINGGTGGLSTGFTFGDGDTGIWESSDDNLRFSTLANTRMIIDSSGKVGVGTTTPLQKFHINDGTNVNLQAGAVGTEFQIKTTNDADSAYIPLVMRASEFNLMSGNVGIGTTSPTHALQVHDGGSAANYVQVTNGDTGVGVSDGALFGLDADENVLVGTVETTGDLRLLAGSDEIRFTNGGNVGIGTTTPAEKLHIYDGNIRLENSVAGGNYWRIVHNSADTFAVKDDSGVDYFTINSDGNIGIGITSPSEKIDIAGGLRVDNDSWISARDTAGTGFVNMFKVNTNDEIEVGGQLNIGTLGLAEDSGAVTFVNMPVSSTPTAGTEESFSFSLDSTPVLKVYGEADGSGGIQNAAVKVDGSLHANGFCDENGANCQTIVELANTGTDSQTLTWTDATNILGISGGNTVEVTGFQAADADLTDLADGSLTGSKVGTGIAAGNITTGTLPNSVLDADLQDLADGSLTGSKVGTGISGTNITTGTVADARLTTNVSLLGQTIEYGELTAMTSANLATKITNETGTGVVVFNTSPTFTGTVSGITAGMVGLGNVTNESKATMFTNAALTGIPTAPTATAGTNTTQLATTAFVTSAVTSGADTDWVESGGDIYRATGNVGIGTTSPDELLDISATGNATIQLTSTGSNQQGQALGKINFYSADTSTPGAGVKASITAWVESETATEGDASSLAFYTSNGSSNNSERLRIDKLGNVGIGTTSPDAELNVATSNGAANINLDSFDDGAGTSVFALRKSHIDTVGTKTTTLTGDILGQIQFQGVDSGSAFDTGAYIRAVQNGTAGVKVPTDLILESSTGAATNANQLVLATNGNVGIGAASPQSKLNINGGVGSLATGLTFGDGDSGIYQQVDNQLDFVVNSVRKLRLDSGYLDMASNDGATLSASAPSATIPVFLPRGRNDQNTGIGSAAADQVSLIAGGSEIVNVATTGITVNGNIAVTGTVDGVDVSTLSTTVGTNTSNIATNTSGIADNVTAIASNADNIAINTGVISGKADMVSGATSGNIAGLDAYGNLTDSGLALNDTGTGITDLWSAQQITSAIQGSAVPEADTLATVTGRGATTTTGITVGSLSTSGTITSGAITATGDISTTVNTGSSYGIRLTDTNNNGTGNSMLEATGSSLFLKGVGSVQTYSDILPVSNLGEGLGSSSRKWGGLFTASLVDDGNSVELNNEIIVERSATAGNASSSNQTILGVTDTSAARTITLSTGDVVDGRIIIIKDESGGASTNNITIVTEGSQTIDGAASIAITVDYGVLRVYSNGTNWFSF